MNELDAAGAFAWVVKRLSLRALSAAYSTRVLIFIMSRRFRGLRIQERNAQRAAIGRGGRHVIDLRTRRNFVEVSCGSSRSWFLLMPADKAGPSSDPSKIDRRQDFRTQQEWLKRRFSAGVMMGERCSDCHSIMFVPAARRMSTFDDVVPQGGAL
jgi:hypothetical protein